MDEEGEIREDESSGGDPSRRLRASEVRALKVEDASGEVQGQRLGDARDEGQRAAWYEHRGSRHLPL